MNKQSEDLVHLQKKVETLLQRIETPLVDEMPNLALRSLGKSSSSAISFNRIALFSNLISFNCVQTGSQVFPELSSPTYWPVEDCGKWSGALCSWFRPQSHHRVIQVGITHLLWNVITRRLNMERNNSQCSPLRDTHHYILGIAGAFLGIEGI